MRYRVYMPNVTLVIGDEVLRLACFHALEAGTSVNALVRRHLEDLVAKDDSAIRHQMVEHALASAGSSGGTRDWNRDVIHDRR